MADSGGRPNLAARTGGRILVDQLLLHGAEMGFCVPGESYLAVLDALYDHRDRFTLINARHEAGAANMAEAYGKLTGKPGIAMVTRGPGACHGAVGVHTAMQDSTPMILLIGQVGRDMRDREAFQEIDYRQMFGPIAKWAAEIDMPSRIPEYMARAFHVATSGRPGPVVLSLPEDMLTEETMAADAGVFSRLQPSPSPLDMERLRSLLGSAERPMLLVGGSGWTDEACRDIARFAEGNGIPATCSFRRQDVFPNRSPNYAGELGTSAAPALQKRLREADLLLVVGARLGEMTTQGYTLVEPPVPRQKLVHVYPDADEIGRVYQPDFGIASGPAGFAAAAAAMQPVESGGRRAWLEKARADYLDHRRPAPYEGELDLARAITALDERLPPDFVLTMDAGNFSGWVFRYITYGRPGRQLGPTSGAMGYAVPAAVSASLASPGRVVIGCVGDGGFLMTASEISTAVHHGATPIILVFNNRMYGTIRMHQEREHPGRVIGTDLMTPDFAEMARSMGAHAETVRRTDEFLPAFDRALASGKAAVIELQTDPEQITTRTTLSAVRKAALERQGR